MIAAHETAEAESEACSLIVTAGRAVSVASAIANMLLGVNAKAVPK
jgi:hypothetical protein